MKYRDSILDALNMLLDDCIQKVSDDQRRGKVKAWHIGLEDLTDEQVYIGLKKALSNNNGFLLSCGQFKELCLTDIGQNSIEDQGHEAWGLIMKNLNPYTSPIFKNTAIAEAIRKMGGWQKICGMLTKDEPFIKKEFLALYSITKRRNEKYDPMLGGLHSSHKFIGYSKDDDTDKVLIDIENKKNTEHKLLEMLNKK